MYHVSSEVDQEIYDYFLNDEPSKVTFSLSFKPDNNIEGVELAIYVENDVGEQIESPSFITGFTVS